MVTIGLQNGHKAGVSIEMLEVTYSRKFGFRRSSYIRVSLLLWEARIDQGW
jgi:hypothetical protein